jgi:hypothetical protein
MKKVLAIVAITLLSTNVYATETKKVCHDKEVKGKTVQVCKDVKVHEKLEGTKVPVKK